MIEGVEFDSVSDRERGERSWLDAEKFIENWTLPKGATLTMNDEGVTTYQWRGDKIGVAVLFVGNGKVSACMKTETRNYLDGEVRFGISEPPPAEFAAYLTAAA